MLRSKYTLQQYTKQKSEKTLNQIKEKLAIMP